MPFYICQSDDEKINGISLHRKFKSRMTYLLNISNTYKEIIHLHTVVKYIDFIIVLFYVHYKC